MDKLWLWKYPDESEVHIIKRDQRRVEKTKRNLITFNLDTNIPSHSGCYDLNFFFKPHGQKGGGGKKNKNSIQSHDHYSKTTAHSHTSTE